MTLEGRTRELVTMKGQTAARIGILVKSKAISARKQQLTKLAQGNIQDFILLAGRQAGGRDVGSLA